MLGLATKELDLTEKDFRRISSIVYDHCGINLHEGKRELVRSRLAKRIRLLKLNSFAEYIDLVLNESNEVEFSNMIDSICTNLTSFFRERQHFDFLYERHLNTLIQSKQNKKVRIWSAGCSSGEEPYSIAVSLADKFEGMPDWDCKVLATDVSNMILERAKNGIYDLQRIAPVEIKLRNRYMTMLKENGVKYYQMNSFIKKMIQFAYLNLMEEFPFKGPIDVIFCRNVMIYFDKPTQERLVQKFWNVLGRGGILFTGHSESLTGINHKFKYVQPTIYQKN